MKKDNDLKVFISSKNSTCDECKDELGKRAFITLEEGKGALCLSCSDLDHLVFLPSGDAALTRRSNKYSTLSAVVLQWSKSRRRYERQGLLVEEEALDKAEQECLADSDVRKLKNKRAAVKRAELDEQYVSEFAKKVCEIYPSCPKGKEIIIAEHACLKYSGRVGRSASAKELKAKSITLAVRAHIRHTESPYDSILARGFPRKEAREAVKNQVDTVLKKWGEGRG